uniref:Large ribosomal subunit protein mL51 n=2 Tax=Sus scrofa TaxID=9823 RepID=A0A8D1J0Y7_PIG
MVCIIGILGNLEKHPKELIKGPIWLRGWKGNELQHCIRKKRRAGNRMFTDDLHNLNKGISYLYKHFNQRGKYGRRESWKRHINHPREGESDLYALSNKMGLKGKKKKKKKDDDRSKK